MSINNNPYDFLNTPALDAMRKLQETSALTAALKMETTGAFAAVRELQSTLNAVKSSMGGTTAALEEYRRTVAPISESIKAMNLTYAPIFEQTKAFDTLNIKGIISGLQTSASAMSAILGLNLSRIASIIDALPKYDFLSDMVTDDFSVDVAEKLYESGEITQDDINEEITEIVNKKQFSPKAEWDKIKKSKWFIAIKILIIITTFVCNPVTEYATEKALDKLGINEFWEDSGVYDLIDSIFGESEDSTVSETEAKKTVDKTKTGNVSKQRREDLLAKIKEIRTFISAAPQDENTGNLLSYLSELEKDVNGKKYGLVFEEHCEEIDAVLDTHTPVLTEDKDLFIDNGGQMNFLIEGDNLASLKLLEKTHKGKIDLIYIDPPYNTGKKDFIYDDRYVDKEDSYRHSKWISFMYNRLHIAKSLLSKNGVIFISIDDNELANLRLLCDSVFGEQNFVAIISVENNPKGRKNSNYVSVSNDYCLIYARNINEGYFIENIPKDIKDLARDEEGNYVHNSGKRVLVGENHFNSNVTDFSSDKHYTIYHNHEKKQIIIHKDADVKETDVNLISQGYVRYFSYNENGFVYNTYTEQKIKELFNMGALDFKNGKIYEKNFSTCIRIKSIVTNKKYKAVLNNEEIDYALDVKTTSAKTDLKQLFNAKESPFSNPKNTGLIKLLISLVDRRDISILDFFAGSGTTGDAVMKLNAEDGGNRRFILCTNNENNICREVTYERIKRVIGKDGYAASLKYYKVDYVPISARMYYEYADELLKHIRELAELENAINFTGNTEIAIVLTEEELDEFISHIDENCKKLYLGHDILMDAQQAQVLKDRKITVNIIPDYYYKELEG